MRDINKIKRQKRIMRHRRVRAGIRGTANKPRLNIFRSNRHIFLQLINDEKGKTIVSSSDLPVKGVKKKAKVASKSKETKTQVAFEAGKVLAVLAKEKKIQRAVFDRGGYAYHGRVKAAAEGARLGGLKF